MAKNIFERGAFASNASPGSATGFAVAPRFDKDNESKYLPKGIIIVSVPGYLVVNGSPGLPFTT